MTTVFVNELAFGAWANKEGTALVLCGPGANAKHVIVARPGERKTFGFPAAWLDGMPAGSATEPQDPQCGAATPPGTIDPPEPLAIDPPQSLEEFVFDYVNERDPDTVFAAIAEWEKLQEVAP
jgi:hypothetical protein